MKKLAVVATLAVLLGGMPAAFAQSITGYVDYSKYNSSSKSDQKKTEAKLDQKALVARVMQDTNKANLTFQRVFRWEEYITTTSPTTGVSISTATGEVSYSTRPYPLATGKTFSGYMYKDTETNKNYVVVSEKVWKAINENCGAGGAITEETFTNTNGTKVSSSGKAKVTTHKVGDTNYKLIAFPVK